jgi:hypothetical protein
LGENANYNTYFALHIQCTKHGHVVYNAKIPTDGDCTHKVMVVMVCLYYKGDVSILCCILIRENHFLLRSGNVIVYFGWVPSGMYILAVFST